MVLCGIGIFAHHETGDSAPSWTRPVPMPEGVGDHQHGGSVKVVVSTPPEIADTGEGGDTLRSLTRPRLFDPQPNGTWRASLVQPGTDRTTVDGRTAQFKLRSTTWSNGDAIGVADLRRTVDARFIASIDGPDANGLIKLHFTQKLPGWRMLWSDAAGIAPPDAKVSGGPFTLESVVSGYETVVHRNPMWFTPAFLDELRLQYVPDATTARQLLQHGDADVVRPVADTMRSKQFAADGIVIDRDEKSGQWMALQFNTANVPTTTRVAALAAFPRGAFVASLLPDEATVVDDLGTGHTWRGALPAGGRLDGTGLTISAPIEHPLSRLLVNSFTRSAATLGAIVRDRITDSATVTGLVQQQTYDIAMTPEQDGPVPCWQCRFGAVDRSLAQSADAGSKPAAAMLEAKVRDGGVLLPLWRDVPMVAFRSSAVSGVHANGYLAGAAWNAQAWWKP